MILKKLLALLFALIFTLSPMAVSLPSSIENNPSLDNAPIEGLPSTDEVPTLPEVPIAPETPTLPETPDEPSTPVAPAPQVTYDEYVRCVGDGVNIRAGASTSYAVLGTAEKGTVYAITGKIGNWYQTIYRGKTAYVHYDYFAVFRLQESDNKEVEAVLGEAYKHIGVPYVYGAVRVHDGNGNLLKGFSAQKFDCSSLVQYAFYKGANTLLQVTTRTQIKQGKYVARADIRRGDCLFFTNADRQHLSGIERVGHVAVYLGDNYILHTASDYARIEQISAKRWGYFIEARRFV